MFFDDKKLAPPPPDEWEDVHDADWQDVPAQTASPQWHAAPQPESPELFGDTSQDGAILRAVKGPMRSVKHIVTSPYDLAKMALMPSPAPQNDVIPQSPIPSMGMGADVGTNVLNRMVLNPGRDAIQQGVQDFKNIPPSLTPDVLSGANALLHLSEGIPILGGLVRNVENRVRGGDSIGAATESATDLLAPFAIEKGMGRVSSALNKGNPLTLNVEGQQVPLTTAESRSNPNFLAGQKSLEGTSTPVNDFVGARQAALEGNIQNQVNPIASVENAGKQVRSAAQGNVKAILKQASDKYDSVFQNADKVSATGQTAPLIAATQQTIDGLTEAGLPVPAELKRILDLEDTVPLRALKDQRSVLLDNVRRLSGSRRRNASMAAGEVDNAIDQGFKDAGLDSDLKDWRDANAIYKKGVNLRDNSFITKLDKIAPEKLADQLGKMSLEDIRTLRDNVPQSTFENLVQHNLQNTLTKSLEGAASPNMAASNVAAQLGQATNTMEGGSIRSTLDNLNNSGRMKELTQGNPALQAKMNAMYKIADAMDRFQKGGALDPKMGSIMSNMGYHAPGVLRIPFASDVAAHILTHPELYANFESLLASKAGTAGQAAALGNILAPKSMYNILTGPGSPER